MAYLSLSYSIGNNHRHLTDRVYAVDVAGEINDWQSLIAGIEHRTEKYRKDYDDPTEADFSDQIDYTSLFAQHDLSLLEDRMSLVLGLRHDHHESFGGELSPKAHIEYELNDSHRIGFGYGHGFKAPTLVQNSDSYGSVIMGGNGFIIGNSALQPETSDSYELSWEYDNGITRARSALFHNDITDLIEAVDTGDTHATLTNRRGAPLLIYQYTNVAEAQTQGIELEWSRPLTDSLDMALSMTVMRTKDGENDNKALQGRPERFGNLSLTHHYPLKNLRTNLNWQYIGQQYMGDGETEKVPGYSLVDLTFTMDLTKTVQIRAGVSNIADTRLAEKSPDFGGAEERGRFYFAGIRKTF